jgi:hypothetical protein
MPFLSTKQRERIDREADLAAALAERFVIGDDVVDVIVEASENSREDYFSIDAGGYLAFSQDDWRSSTAIALDLLAHLLCQPVDELAAVLIAEIRRRAVQDPLRVVRNIDPDWLARAAVKEGSIDGVLSLLNDHAVDDRPHWDEVRSYVFATLLEQLASLDLAGDERELDRQLRRLVAIEAERRGPPESDCQAARCPGSTALLQMPVPHPAGRASLAICTLCFLGRFYLPPDHLSLAQRSSVDLNSGLSAGQGRAL